MGGQRGDHLPKWVTQKEVAGGGVLMYSAIHGLDRLRWLVGSEVVRVTAETHTYSPDAEVEDGVAALLTFANGATATLNPNAPAYRAQPTHWETELYGDKGLLRIRTRHFAELSNDKKMDHVEQPPSVTAWDRTTILHGGRKRLSSPYEKTENL